MTFDAALGRRDRGPLRMVPRVLLLEESAYPLPIAGLFLHLHARGQIQLAFAEHFDFGMDELAAGSYDVVLLDPAMPSASTRDAVEELRTACKEVALIVSVPSARENEGLAALARGADAYLLSDVDASHTALRHVQIAVAHHRRFEDERLMPKHDPVTGLLSRRGLLEHADRMVTRAKRYGWRLALMLVSMECRSDDGRNALANKWMEPVSRSVGRRLRATDAACRYADDQLAVLFENVTTEPGVTSWMERWLRDALCPAARSESVSVVRVGTALYPDNGDDVAALLRWLDAASEASDLPKSRVVLRGVTAADGPRERCRHAG